MISRHKTKDIKNRFLKEDLFSVCIPLEYVCVRWKHFHSVFVCVSLRVNYAVVRV